MISKGFSHRSPSTGHHSGLMRRIILIALFWGLAQETAAAYPFLKVDDNPEHFCRELMSEQSCDLLITLSRECQQSKSAEICEKSKKFKDYVVIIRQFIISCSTEILIKKLEGENEGKNIEDGPPRLGGR